jgi:hypothetical protein
MSDNNERSPIFSRIAKWLTDSDFEIETDASDPKADHTIKAIIVKRPDPKDSHWFFINFPKAYPDTIIMSQWFYFEDLDLKAFKRLSEKVQQEYFIDLKKSIYPLGVIVDVRDYTVTLRKIIFPESLTRQQFLDYFINFSHAFELSIMKFNELRLSLLPDRKPGESA